MGTHEFRRELIRAANLGPHRLTADQVASMLAWFDSLPGEEFNRLLHEGVEFPNGYIEYWRESRAHEEDD